VQFHSKLITGVFSCHDGNRVGGRGAGTGHWPLARDGYRSQRELQSQEARVELSETRSSAARTAGV